MDEYLTIDNDGPTFTFWCQQCGKAFPGRFDNEGSPAAERRERDGHEKTCLGPDDVGHGVG